MPVERVHAAGVGDDDVVPVAGHARPHERHDAVVGRQDGAAERLDQVDAGVEVGIAAESRLEPERRGPEALRDLRRRLGPDEAELRGMPGAARDRPQRVRLAPELDLRPDRLHGGRDDRVLLALKLIGDRQRPGRVLSVEQVELAAGLGDLDLELVLGRLLLGLQVLELGQVGGQLVAQPV